MTMGQVIFVYTNTTDHNTLNYTISLTIMLNVFTTIKDVKDAP